MTAAERHRLEELNRLKRAVANPELCDWERAEAARMLKALEDGPTCPHCEKLVKEHRGAPCAVLMRFQRRKGKGSIPTADQSREIREAIALDEKSAAKGERTKDMKGRQGGFGF